MSHVAKNNNIKKPTKKEQFDNHSYPNIDDHSLSYYDLTDPNYISMKEQFVGCDDKPIPSINDFHDNFFKFRDITNQISNDTGNDPVDAINRNINNTDMKIQDIYDNMTTNKKKN